ncbi:MAG: DNA (cytosine-5-)-methyltransferase [Bacteroidales bacterium]|nr:DNA (cytosine-5-)-methyltransferase [Bacteroidales bacterium]
MASEGHIKRVWEMNEDAAIVTHYMQLKDSCYAAPYKAEALRILDIQEVIPGSDGVADPSIQLNVFDQLSDVPFAPPSHPKFSFIDLFAGIGGFRLACQAWGGRCVYSSEWDEHAKQTYFANFGDVPFGDITLERTKSFIPEKFDLLCGGFPCQAFSIIGKMKGFADTRGTMFFEIQEILQKHNPPAIFLENVKQLVGHDGGRTFKVILGILDELGYHVKWKVLNALDFGVPQKRERVIIVGFKDKNKYEAFNFEFERKPYALESVLEQDDSVDSKLYASEAIRKKRLEKVAGKPVFYPSMWHENKSGNISVLGYACALRTGASYNYQLVNGYRRPSSRELFRFQGYPEEYKIVVSHQEVRRQTGNSVAIPLMTAVAKKIADLI